MLHKTPKNTHISSQGDEKEERGSFSLRTENTTLFTKNTETLIFSNQTMSSLSTKIVKEAVKAGLPQPICEKTVSFTLGFKAALDDKQFSDPDQPKYVFMLTIFVVLTHT